ncbi:MAG: hypothetical protein LBJ17_01210 [Dysgonamonadaceae bacterium]|jgi:hypothetical protein|nr:hypothetical protein [Dysgonamonadaceae bacterium]
MRNNDYIPVEESKFYAWEVNFVNIAKISYEVWGIPEYKWEELLSEQEEYHDKYALSNDPQTRTSAIVFAKNTARKTFTSVLRKVIKGYITYNLNVTDNNRKTLGLPIHKTTRTPSPKPTEKADFDIKQETGSRLNVHFRYRYSDQEQIAARPPFIHGIEITWAILKTHPESYNDLIHSVFDTRSPYTFQFDIKDAGKKFFCALRWENTRGEKGPWSEIKSAIIP